MSTQIEINSQLVNYLNKTGYHPDPIIDELIQETQILGSISRMQIAPEQGQFLQMIVSIARAKKCLENTKINLRK